MSWADLGARNQADFVGTCRDDWNRARMGIATARLSAALDVCDGTTEAVATLSCEELLALYAEPPLW